MSTSLILGNLLNPAILFFFLGILAVYLKSDLEIPQPIPKWLSLYLIFSIGFKGGVELSHNGVSLEVVMSLLLAMFMAVLVPLYTFYILRKRVGVYNAGAIAATYGSISAVTFITATAFLDEMGVAFGGHMVAAMALMEFPAIVVGVFLVRIQENGGNVSLASEFRDSITNGSVFLILGSLLIGMLTGEEHSASLAPFTEDIFKGMLVLFLLDMGLLVGRRLIALRKAGLFPIIFGLAVPLLNALIGIVLVGIFNISIGNALLLVVLFASASYIAVPAAMRLSLPEANPGLYVPMSLAITFPFNIIVGIPLYYFAIEWINSLI